ncbi:hypothetical protein GCM10009593_02890 [Microlunatus antarcticus]
MVKTGLVLRLTGDAERRAIGGATSEIDDVLRLVLQQMLLDRDLMPRASVRAGLFAPFKDKPLVSRFAPVPARLGRARHKQVTQLGLVIWELVIPFDVRGSRETVSLDAAGLSSPATVAFELPQTDKRLVQLWPSTQSAVMWPPRRGVYAREAQALRQSWDHPPEAFEGHEWRTDLKALRRRRGWMRQVLSAVRFRRS